MNRDFYLGTKDALEKIRNYCREKGDLARDSANSEVGNAYDDVFAHTLDLWSQAMEEWGGEA